MQLAELFFAKPFLKFFLIRQQKQKRVAARKRQTIKVAITKKLALIDKNRCDFRNQHDKVDLNRLSKRKHDKKIEFYKQVRIYILTSQTISSFRGVAVITSA